MKSCDLYDVHTIGDKRTIWVRLAPGDYHVASTKQTVVLKRAVMAKVTETWTMRGLVGSWVGEPAKMDSFIEIPSLWSRVRAWLVGKEPIPRASARYSGTKKDAL